LWSRPNVRDQRTQFTIAGTLATVVLIAAIVGASTGGVDDSSPTSSKTASDSGDPLTSSTIPGEDGKTTTKDGTRVGGRAAAPGARPGSAPVDGDDVGRVVAVNKPEIKVGITYLEDPGTANAAAGFGGVGQIDQKRGWEAVVKDINANLPYGRKIIPVWYSQTTEELTSKGGDRIEQEACAKFTQDSPVDFVWSGGLLGSDGPFVSCSTKAKLPLIGSGGGLSYAQTFKDAPYLVEPASAALDRMAAFQVDQLYDAGFFKGFKENSPPYTPQKPADGKPRIGLIRYDQPSYKAGAATMRARLAAHGLSLCAGCEFEIAYSSDNVQEQLDDATEVNAAIQSCKSKGCTHMLFLGSTNGLRITLFFIDGAEKQQYRPRLGFNPLDGPTVVRDFLGSPSYPQFRDSMMVTWDPFEFGTRTPAYQRCHKIFEDAGETFEGDEASNKEAQIPYYCDTAWYFRAALEAAGPSLDLDSWLDGVHTMKPADASGTYLMQTKSGRHDGVGAIRLGKWDDNCHCFKPITGVIPV
jgi:hypothetical protein